MSFKELGEKADQIAEKAKGETAEVKKEFGGLSKTMKYVIYGVAAIAVLAMGSCMLKGCGSKSVMDGYQNPGVAYNQPAQAQPLMYDMSHPAQPQTVVVNQGAGMGETMLASGVGSALGSYIGTTMANGQVYNGHNWDGPPPAGAEVDPQTHAIKQSTKAGAPKLAPAPVPAKVDPAVAAAKKAKAAPGDAAAEKASLLDQKKADIRARIEQMKAQRAAKTAVQAPVAAPVVKPAVSAPAPRPVVRSGFSSFSQKASSISRGSSSRSSGGRRR